MKIFLLLFSLILVISFNSAYAVEDQDNEETLYFRGNNGVIDSDCEQLTYNVMGSINSDTPVPIKIEILDPNNKIVGVHEDSLNGSFNVMINVDYTENGIYLIHVHYKGEIYEEDYSWSDIYTPTHEEKINCLVAKALNEVKVEHHQLDYDPNYAKTWADSKDSFLAILGDKYEFYEPIISRDILYSDNPRVDTDFAFKELDKLQIILDQYSNATLNHIFELQEQKIKELDISLEDKADVIYERRLNNEQAIQNVLNTNQRVIDQIKQIYIKMDANEKALELEEQQKLEEEKSKQKILEELTGTEPNNEDSTKPILDFVDPTKDPQYYLDRYHNEPEYKNWFDRNYPNYTIEEAVGIELEITTKVPEWVRNTALWYGQGKISEDEFLNAIEFLINEEIIIIIP